MYIAYDNFEGTKILEWPFIWENAEHPNLDCNVCVWMIPGTIDPTED
jgi:hypothetical protein